MKKFLIFLAMPAVLWPAFSLAENPRGASQARELLIVYSGNTLGELKPCGCAKEEDQGGVERRMSYLEKVKGREKNLLLVDAGDNFKEPTRQGRVKARFLLRAMAKMGYDAVLPGEHDFVYGKELMDERKNFPWILSNMEFRSVPWPVMQFKRFDNKLKVALLAVADPGLFAGVKHSGSRVADPEKTVRSLLKIIEGPEKPDLVVLLTHMEREAALALLNLDGVDVIVNGHIGKDTDLIDMTPVRKGEKILVQPGPRGQKMGELRVRIDARGGKTFQQKTVRLDSQFPLDPDMAKLYDEYNGKIEELFFASLSARKDKNSKKVYATEKKCQSCHAEAHRTWVNSRHGHAYATLRKINKAFDPECLTCHVTGFNRPGGFVSEIDTPGLENVQCEVCHGPALQHVQAPGKGFGLDPRQACKTCHVKNHSPRFNYEKYWPKIKH
ncbi:MAG: multiheme c-type cytochrome [Nitrospinaceae bacterium]